MEEHIKHKDKLERYRGLILQFSIIVSMLIVLMLFENKTKSAETIPKNYTQIEIEIEATNNPDNPIKPVPGDSSQSIGIPIIRSLASFPGGDASMTDYLKDNMVYPKEAGRKDIQGRVIVSFTVDETGKVTDPDVIRSIHPLLDTEAIRLVKNMPDWEPEKMNGKPISSVQTTHIIFMNN